MSKPAKAANVTNTSAPARVPALRFPEFRNAGEWKKDYLSQLAKPVTQRAEEGEDINVLTLSAEHGLISQGQYFGRKIAGDKTERYIVISENDFVYNDRTTKQSEFGTIKRLSGIKSGIVSPIYKCFRFNDDETPIFWEHYFDSLSHNPELRGLVNEGARDGRFNISISKFLSTQAYFPSPPEQQKIADCLSSLDELIVAEASKVEALKAHKKGLMQLLFPAEGQTIPALRFPEFRNAGEWKLGVLDTLLVSVSNGLSLPQSSSSSKYMLTRIETISDCSINIDRVGYVDTDDNISDYKLNVGDILFSNINSVAHIGKSVRVDRDYDLYHGMNLLRLVVASHSDDKFVYYLLNTDFIRDSFRLRANKAVNQASINQTEIRKTQVTYPSSKIEQQKIADCLSSLDELIAAQASKVEALKAHKKGLMQQLFPSPVDEAGQ